MKKSVAVMVAMAVVAAVAAAGWPVRVLTLRAADTVIFLRIVQPDDTFLLTYLHSVALSDVQERFAVGSDGNLVLTETRFKGQGAGLPSSLEPNERLSRQGDWMIITGMNRRLPVFCWRVQKQWNNRFRFDDSDEMNLSHRIGDGLVWIQVERIKLVNWIGYMLFGINPKTIQERR